MLVTLVFDNDSLDSPKSHNNTNKQTDRDSGRPAVPVFCEVKLPISPMEFGWCGDRDNRLI